MFDHRPDRQIILRPEHIESLALIVRHAWPGVPSVMPEHSYVDLLGKEYHIRRQRPAKQAAAFYRIATTEWGIQFFGPDESFPWPSERVPKGLTIWDSKFAGWQDVFYNDLTMFRVAF